MTGMLLLAASCAKDTPATSGAEVHFTISVKADTDTKAAYGDASAVTQLLVGVLDSAGNPIEEFRRTVSRSSASEDFSFSLELVEGLSYRLVLFAQSPDRFVNNYSVTTQLQSIPLPNTIDINSETGDAFWACQDIEADAHSQSITLRRAWAQVNIGTSASDASAVTAVALSIPGLPTHFNACTGEASGSQVVSMTASNVISDLIGYPSYSLLAYAYIPVGQTPLMVDPTLTISRGSSSVTTNLTNIPLRANYRTNILGNF